MNRSTIFKYNESINTLSAPLKIQKDEEFLRVKNIVSNLIIESSDVETTKQLLEVYDYINKISYYSPRVVTVPYL